MKLFLFLQAVVSCLRFTPRRTFFPPVLVALLVGASGLGRVSAQVGGAPHRIDGLDRPDLQHVRLTLTGGPTNGYEGYEEVFPIESSGDLQHWTVTETVVRTNALPGPVQYLQTCTNGARFFRTPVNAFPTAFPKPSGPYSVGTVSRLFASETRTSTQVGPNRKFMVSIFYPATQSDWRPSQFIFEPIYGPVLFPYQFVTNPRSVETIITNLVSYAWPGLPVLAGTNTFPVLVYCHGAGYFRRDNIHKLSELASHGYIVVAADDYDSCYSYLPDGTLVTGVGRIHGGESYSVADTRFMLDELERMNTSDSMFAGRFDLSRIGLMGWSVGGAVAGDVCRLDPRVKAAVLYDAAFWIAPELSVEGLNKPFLCINATIELDTGWAAPAVRMYNQAKQDAMFFQLDGTYHTEFSDIILMDYPGITELQRTGLIVDYTRAFFNHYLLGTSEPLLDAAPSSGTAIVNWMKK